MLLPLAPGEHGAAQHAGAQGHVPLQQGLALEQLYQYAHIKISTIL